MWPLSLWSHPSSGCLPWHTHIWHMAMELKKLMEKVPRKSRSMKALGKMWDSQSNSVICRLSNSEEHLAWAPSLQKLRINTVLGKLIVWHPPQCPNPCTNSLLRPIVVEQTFLKYVVFILHVHIYTVVTSSRFLCILSRYLIKSKMELWRTY